MEQIIDLIKEIIINLVASLVYAALAFFVVYLYNLLTKWFYKRKFYKSTRLNINNKEEKYFIKCYMANSGRYDESENVYLGYPFEYMSAASINSYLSMMVKIVDMEPHPCPLKVNEIAKIDKTKDLILLGGPFHNILTKLFFGLVKDKTNLPLYFDTFEGEEATLFYKENGANEYKTAKPLKDMVGNYYSEDYGLIINIKNPYNPSKRVIALMGCRSIGVLGATLAFTTFNKEIFKKVKDDQYAVIVKCYGDRNNVDIERPIEFITSIALNDLKIENLINIVDRETISI